MESQNFTIDQDVIGNYKNAIDSFGGPFGISEKFGWSISTVYKWMAGQAMGLSYALCISSQKPAFTIESLVGYELDCERIYIEVVGYFGSQTAVAKALSISQNTVHSWLKNGGRISGDKAELLEVITKGKFHPSDFEHLK